MLQKIFFCFPFLLSALVFMEPEAATFHNAGSLYCQQQVIIILCQLLYYCLDECHHYRAVVRLYCFVNNHAVTVEDASIFHTVTLHITTEGSLRM